MTALAEIAEWNRRLKDTGWRSAPAPDLPCEKCQQDRCVVVTTLYGKTTAACDCCGHGWRVEVPA